MKTDGEMRKSREEKRVRGNLMKRSVKPCGRDVENYVLDGLKEGLIMN